MGLSIVLILALFVSTEAMPSCDPSSSPKVSVDIDSSFAISNGYVCVIGSPGSISYAGGDHTGSGNYGTNVFTNDGLTLERENNDGSIVSTANLASSDVQTSIVDANDNYVSVLMEGIQDKNSDDGSTFSENWFFQLNKSERSFTFQRQGSFINDIDVDVLAIRRMWSLQPTSMYAWYEDLSTSAQSIMQMKNANDGLNFFPSEEHLLRFYSLGGSGDETEQVGNVSIDIMFETDIMKQNIRQENNDDGSSTNELNVLLSSNSGDPYWSGLQEVLFGGTNNVQGWFDKWGVGWATTESSTLTSNNTDSWDSTISVYVNDLDFPAGAISTISDENLEDMDDLHAFLMGIYASPAGTLCTHKNAVGEGVAVGQIATTIARPDYGYSGTYNYFDPDNYISTSALLWSGDRFLQEQVRLVLERSGSFLTSEGQLPHHFEGTEPTYEALSGEIQTGPNTFWILSCFNYAKSSGNLDWLVTYMPTLRLASNFLYDNIDNEFKLANVPGSLMIDVFLRSNFTSDTNAMLVGFFREFAQAESFVGNATGAAKLFKLAESISKAMNQHLWCRNTTGYCDSFIYPQDDDDANNDDDAAVGDHFVTQWDGEETPTPYHDFMDYDANLMACAHGVPNDNLVGDDGGARAKRILARIDGGQCRPSATFVSERYYGPDDTTGGNVGDSWCAMGRIAWFDALSRQRYGDSETFTDSILRPLQSQLLSTTWMHERVQCDGLQMLNRTAMYFEYPSMVAMLLYRIKYGIELDIDGDGASRIAVQPFTVDAFSYHINNMDIEFASDYFSFTVQRPSFQSGGDKSEICYFKVVPVAPLTNFTLSYGVSGGDTTITSDANGKTTFSVPILNNQIIATLTAV